MDWLKMFYNDFKCWLIIERNLMCEMIEMGNALNVNMMRYTMCKMWSDGSEMVFKGESISLLCKVYWIETR